LGNVRLVFTESNGLASIVQENHYYPFGMQQNGNWAKTQTVKNDYLYNGKELNTEIGLNWSDYGARFYDASIGRWVSPDPLAEFAPEWTTYRYGFNNPISYVDPDGLFESKETAQDYANDNNIKTGGIFGIFRKNKIVEQADGTWGIENKSEHSVTQDLGEDLGGVQTFASVAANDVMSQTKEGNAYTFTHRDGTENNVQIVIGTPPDIGRGASAKLTISAIKKALTEVHKKVGKLPKGKKGKFGSAQRGDKTKGYRLDKEGHPKSKNPNEKGPHINWWDFTKGKWNKGKGPGSKGAVPID